MPCVYILEVFFLVLVCDKNLRSTRLQFVLCQFTENFKVGGKADIKAALVNVIVPVISTSIN